MNSDSALLDALSQVPVAFDIVALFKAAKRASTVSARSVRGAFDSRIHLALDLTFPELLEPRVPDGAVDGDGISCNQPAAKLPGVRFSDDSKESPRGRLDAAQELVRAVRPCARTVPVASPHRCFNKAFPNERFPEMQPE